MQGVMITDDIFASDLMNDSFPARHYLGAMLQHGEFPLWYSSIYGGFPLIARAEAAEHRGIRPAPRLHRIECCHSGHVFHRRPGHVSVHQADRGEHTGCDGRRREFCVLRVYGGAY